MSLIDFWTKSREDLSQKHVQQIIAIAGEGKLTDDSKTSEEFRAFLRVIPSEKLSDYAHNCLEDAFDNSGLVLQDIINEVGARLGFAVEPGRYRGRKGMLGHDGLWTLKNGRQIVVEVKTTDAYAIDLTTISEYRKMLAKEGNLTLENSSILLVVGRKDTGGLEAQIRGSRFGWDMRIISVDALLSLMTLKETLDDPVTLSKISDILVPQEFTRLDGIVDLVFSAAEEVASVDENEPDDQDDSKSASDRSTGKKFTPMSFHGACASRIEKHLSASLIKESRTSYKDPQKDLRILVAVSKLHGSNTAPNYWFAFHPHQREFLEGAQHAYVALGCGSADTLFLVPLSVIVANLDKTWTTYREDRMYWHIRIEMRKKKYSWALRKGSENVPIDEFLVPSEK